MPVWRITAPRNLGRVQQGTSFTVVSRTTSPTPNAEDIEEVLCINGYTESGGTTARSYRSAGNWECEKISDETYPAWDKQHQKYKDAMQATSAPSGGNSGGGGKKESSGGSKKSSGGRLFGSSSDDGGSSSEPAPEPIPMSPEERAIVESPIEIKATPAEELEWLVEHYLVVSKITSQVSEEIGLINSKLEALKECIVKLPIPADLTRLFALALAVETYIKKNNMFNDIPGKEIKKLRSNIADHMKRPNMKHNAEVHAMAAPMMEDDLFKKTPIYDRIIVDKIEDASARGLAEDAEFIANHFNAHLEARDALRNMKIVTEREEMLKVAKVLQKAMEDSFKFGSAAMSKAIEEAKSSPFGAITGGIGMVKEGMNKATIGTIGTLKDTAQGMMKGKMVMPSIGDDVVYREKLRELLDKADELFPGDAEFAAFREAIETSKKKKKKRYIILGVSYVALILIIIIILLVVLAE